MARKTPVAASRPVRHGSKAVMAGFAHIAEGLRPLAVPIERLLPDAANARRHPDRNIESIKASLVSKTARKRLTPRLAIRAVPVDTIHENPHNVRRHPERNMESIKQSLARFGQAEPLVVQRSTGMVIGGNGRLAAMRTLGWKTVEIVEIDADTQTATALGVALNRTAELAEWDDKALVEMLKTLQVAGELPNVGFDEDELRNLVRSLDGAQGDGFDPEAALAANPELASKVQRGQVWRLGRHRLMCGDCTEGADVARLTSGIEMDAVVTDPPYGIGREGIPNDDEAGIGDTYRRALATLPVRNAVVAVFQSPRLFPTWLDAARRAGHAFQRALFIYKPDDETFPWRGWICNTEMILLTTVGQGRWYELHPYQQDVYTVSMSRIIREDGQVSHPTVKSLEVTRDLLQRVCPPGRAVFDGFAGSGTTLIAAEQGSRSCCAMEVEPLYCAVAIARWEAETGESAVLDA